MKRQTDMSSSVYYRSKDHKDVYWQGTFHCAMYMKDKDESVHDIIWRKKWRDRYFAYTTQNWTGSSSAGTRNGYTGVCYIKEKINTGSRFWGTRRMTVNNEFTVLSSDSDSFRISTDDEKTFHDVSFNGYFEYGKSFKNGVFGRHGISNYKLITFKDNDEGLKEIDTMTTIWPTSSYQNIYTIPNGESYLGIRQYSYGNIWYGDHECDEAWKVWNSNTLEEKIFYIRRYRYNQQRDNVPIIDTGNGAIIGANGRTFIVYAEQTYTYDYVQSRTKMTSSKIALHEVGEDDIIGKSVTSTIDGNVSYRGISMKYVGGRYYLYVGINVVTDDESYFDSLIYTSDDCTEWTKHELPTERKIPHIVEGKDPYTLRFRGPYDERNNVNVFQGYYVGQYSYPIFENNKRVENPTDLAFSHKTKIMYFDNPLLNYSGNNFWFDVEEAMVDKADGGSADNQGMFKKYYNIKEET